MEKIKKYIVFLLFTIVIAGLVVLFAYINISVFPEFQYAKYEAGLVKPNVTDTTFNQVAELKTLNKKIDQLNKKMSRLTPPMPLPSRR